MRVVGVCMVAGNIATLVTTFIEVALDVVALNVVVFVATALAVAVLIEAMFVEGALVAAVFSELAERRGGRAGRRGQGGRRADTVGRRTAVDRGGEDGDSRGVGGAIPWS